MEITEERINAAYSVADENMKKVLDALFADKTAKDDRPVTERVKTFDDAVKEIGEDHPYVKALRAAEETGDENLVQYCRLRIITMALNEGWTPKFTEGEYRYWPYFWLYKDEEAVKEYAGSDEKIKPLHESVRCVLWGGAAHDGTGDGFAYASSHDAPSYAYTTVGSRLCFKSRELAVYAADVFGEEWIKFYVL